MVYIMTLPIFQTSVKELSLMETSWASQINPILANPINQANILKNVVLINGTTTVNHLLGRNLQGWFIVGQNALASIHDAQATNQTPNLTLVLISNAAVTINLAVF